MKIINSHLTYCTNIHKNKTWNDTLKNLKKYTIKIKKKICPNKPFGIGLCLSYEMSTNLLTKTTLENFRVWLCKNNMYVFTINGFVYNYFHKKNIKEKIYEPDWSTLERLDYTKNIITILSNLLTINLGSISTTPICYKKKIENRKKKYIIIQKSICNLMEIIVLLEKIKQHKNKKIVICLEPEPDCFLENTHEIIFFYKHILLPYGVDFLQKNYGYTKKNAAVKIFNYIQICYDTCHFAIQQEKPKETFNTLFKNKISIGKIQLSSLIHLHLPQNSFIKKIYLQEQLKILHISQFLHQTHVNCTKKKTTYSCNDFTTLTDLHSCLIYKEKTIRIHYHLPIYKNTFLHCNTTKKYINKTLEEYIKRNINTHLEIETYTWSSTYTKKHLNIVHSVLKEYAYVLKIIYKSNYLFLK